MEVTTLVWWYIEGYHNFMSFAAIGWLMFWLQIDTCLLCHRWIDWKALQERGFKGVIFDKDNTLTAPYALAVWPALAPALQECQSFFNGHIALLSNSAGTSTAHLCFFSLWTSGVFVHELTVHLIYLILNFWLLKLLTYTNGCGLGLPQVYISLIQKVQRPMLWKKGLEYQWSATVCLYHPLVIICYCVFSVNQNVWNLNLVVDGTVPGNWGALVYDVG